VSTYIGIGFSRHADNQQAAREAALQARTNLGADRIDMALVLSTVHYDPRVSVPIIYEALNNARLIGCSTAGIILSKSIETRGIAVLTIISEDMQFGIGCVENIFSLDTSHAGAELASSCLTNFGKHGRQIFVFFVDSHLKSVSPLLKSLQNVLGSVFPIVGAGSCDDFLLGDSFQIFQDKTLKNAATGLMMGGHMHVGVGVRHGWRPLGKPRLINKADRNIIKSIDDKRACSIYEEYLGDEAKDLRSNRLGQMAILYPLGICIEGSKEYLLRNAVDIEQDGSIVCQGDVSQGSEVHIMIGNKDSCVQAAFEAAQEAHQNLLGKSPKLIIILESMSRLKLLGRAAFQEVLRIKEVFGQKVPLIGMYTNGEICPLQLNEKFKKPHLQNENIVILAIS
jgi:hypothetical protein